MVRLLRKRAEQVATLTALSAWLAGCLVLVAGCAAGRPLRWASAANPPRAAVLFNPPWTGLDAADVARRPWPLTTVESPPVGYQEFFIHFRDTQRSWSGRSRDDVYRRVDEVRAGFR